MKPPKQSQNWTILQKYRSNIDDDDGCDVGGQMCEIVHHPVLARIVTGLGDRTTIES